MKHEFSTIVAGEEGGSKKMKKIKMNELTKEGRKETLMAEVDYLEDAEQSLNRRSTL